MTKTKFTKHARAKFEILKRHGVKITPDQVYHVIEHPDKVIAQLGSRVIAQKRISDRHVLRVVYREEGALRVVVTFYPGRRERYED